MYLPATAQELLFNRMQGLTATGSRVGIEALSPNFGDPAAAAQRRERIADRTPDPDFHVRVVVHDGVGEVQATQHELRDLRDPGQDIDLPFGAVSPRLPAN